MVSNIIGGGLLYAMGVYLGYLIYAIIFNLLITEVNINIMHTHSSQHTYYKVNIIFYNL